MMLLGIDVGSTTVKISLVEGTVERFSYYMRHNAQQREAVCTLLEMVQEKYPGITPAISFCGSGGHGFAEEIRVPYTQEVVANAVAIKARYPQIRTAIELGGQDAKVVLFAVDPQSGQLVTQDMRMNGSCAGGTGAFIDQIAELLSVPVEEMNGLAEQGTQVYEVSGRCGVFAKTDIQPLLNQGVPKTDIALSAFHAIAKQTIGGLAQGIDLAPPIIFEGGPLTFNAELRKVFCERLKVTPEDALLPENAHCIIAYGAARSLDHAVEIDSHEITPIVNTLRSGCNKKGSNEEGMSPYFENEREREEFTVFHTNETSDFDETNWKGRELPVYIGLDAGSTTSKVVVLSNKGSVVDSFYASNDGEPLEVITRGLMSLRDRFRKKEIGLKILGLGTTGYGEELFAKAFNADFHTVETVAHAEAAKSICPEVSFILDIGGQDMKAMFLRNGVITNIILNEACSAGCGSFLETYAQSMGIAVQDVAEMAFESRSPSKLGSRCTVFMNSSVITEQKNGKSPEDIMAGLCRSVIENVFTKVVRISNLKEMGGHIVVQGGTFKNDAVLRAFEEHLGLTVIRPKHPGLMGAIGVALLAKKEMERSGASSTSMRLDALERFTYTKQAGQVCRLCSNLCNRTVVSFSDSAHFVTGNKCEKGKIIGDAASSETRAQVAELNSTIKAIPDLVRFHGSCITADYGVEKVADDKKVTIGIPRVLDFWQTLPFWKALFTSLGYTVVVSDKSSHALFESGLSTIPSDTICYPAKLVHGHIQNLVEKNVDRVFLPMMISRRNFEETEAGTAVCPVVQGYALVIDSCSEITEKHGIRFDYPVLDLKNPEIMQKQIVKFLDAFYTIPKKEAVAAFKVAEQCQFKSIKRLQDKGRSVVADLKDDEFAIVLAGRPYQYDPMVNHFLSQHFIAQGIPVVTLDAIDHTQYSIENSRVELTNSTHSKLLSATLAVANNPKLELCQIVSFGCGHDAILSDEMNRIMSEHSDKSVLQLKLDEGDVKGPVSIRVRSFIETVRKKRGTSISQPRRAVLSDPYPVKFTKEDAKKRKVLVPNLSPSFSRVVASIFKNQGIEMEALPVATPAAIALGKKYVNNDICYPAQINIGEMLEYLETNDCESSEIALGLAKNCDNCRAGQYAALARQALDDAGYSDIPIMTTGDDKKNMHPGFKSNMAIQIRMVWGIALIDCLEIMVRRMRPYEIHKGEVDRVYTEQLALVCAGFEVSIDEALKRFKVCVTAFNEIGVDATKRKPQVGLLGEIFVKYHPAANAFIERYLESHGMEVIQPPMLDFFRRDDIIRKYKRKNGMMQRPFMALLVGTVSEAVYAKATKKINNIFKSFKLYEHHADVYELHEHVNGFIDTAFKVGEGWLIAGELFDLAKRGVNSFVIVQPFGCMPNHVSGRGMTKVFKKEFPHIQVLSLDYDPDTSMANVENRLQMLVMRAREQQTEVG
ncbi:MAG: acyl-CoA dehydratase activase [Fibrobacterales bacterium]